MKTTLRTLFAAAFALCFPSLAFSQYVDDLVARNVEARGGAEAWRAVSSLRLTGRMDVGQGLLVPYVLEQKRPSKMRLEYEFDEETAVQCYDGKAGWKIAPFLGKTSPEPMTAEELREAAGSADLYGLLFDYSSRGHRVVLVGQEPVDGRDAFKLEVTLPGGSMRWVYLDTETGLEVKVEAVQKVAGRERRIETFYRDWKAVDGLLIARRQETRTVGSNEFHALTVEKVTVNPPLDDSRFAMPTAAQGRGGGN